MYAVSRYEVLKGSVQMAYQDKSHREGFQNDPPLDFADERDVQGKDDELYLSEDSKIFDSKMVKNYGKRVDYLRKNSFSGKIMSLEEIGRACGVTKQAMYNVVHGKNKSVDPKQCNVLAHYFECSAWYLLGICEERKGIAVNGKEYIMPLRQLSSQSRVNILDASNWSSIDPELFELVRQTFLLDPATRHIICDILKPVLKMASI